MNNKIWCSKQDGEYIPPKNPIQIGKDMEETIIKYAKCKYCKNKLIPEKKNNPVSDAYHICGKRGIQKLQIKTITTIKDYYPNRIPVTKPSKLGTCNSKLKIIKVHNSKIIVFSPHKPNAKGQYYIHKMNNRWGNPVLEMVSGVITKKNLDLKNILF